MEGESKEKVRAEMTGLEETHQGWQAAKEDTREKKRNVSRSLQREGEMVGYLERSVKVLVGEV